MPTVREVIIHYSCDRKHCKASGKASKLPEGWRHFGMLIPGGVEGSPYEVKGILCPSCAEWLKACVEPSMIRKPVTTVAEIAEELQEAAATRGDGL